MHTEILQSAKGAEIKMLKASKWEGDLRGQSRAHRECTARDQLPNAFSCIQVLKPQLFAPESRNQRYIKMVYKFIRQSRIYSFVIRMVE